MTQHPVKAPGPRRQAFGYDVEYSIDSMGFLGEMIDIIEGLGWNLHDVVCEGGYSQFEFGLSLHRACWRWPTALGFFSSSLLKEVPSATGCSPPSCRNQHR
ncbi:MAG: hypothetical protein Ct9H300mP14_04320 [Gammaproteobacteria bacterium]|nr:MAG: hypothetical protein Ct9H300mP14_04320 [Gammaproteobacteria bacterium]